MTKNVELGLLISRIMLGISFFVHGLSKFQGGIGNTANWFDSIGIPGLLAYVVATIELVGGLLMILGLGTRIIAVLFGIIMLVAILKVKLSAGFLGDGQRSGYELDLVLLALSSLLALSGSRLYSLDHLFFRSHSENK
jgi:putative oxidoreductase